MTEGKKKTTAGRRSSSSSQDKLYVEQVRQLVNMLVENGLTHLEIENGDLKVSLGRGGQQPAAAAPAPAAFAPAPAPAQPAPAEPAEDLHEITSPMVGVFYAAPSPDSAAYVQPGDKVTGESVVCIVEAMKVMNEIKAECSGEIVEVCVANGAPVEFGQALFRVRT